MKDYLITDIELADKIKYVYQSRTPAEISEDNLRDVKGFLISVRDKHRHKMTAIEAIEKLEIELDKILQKKSEKIILGLDSLDLI
jgi:hypothetical protein